MKQVRNRKEEEEEEEGGGGRSVPARRSAVMRQTLITARRGCDMLGPLSAVPRYRAGFASFSLSLPGRYKYDITPCLTVCGTCSCEEVLENLKKFGHKHA